MNKNVLTWEIANRLRQNGVILSPEWECESEELANAVKHQYEALAIHCHIDNLIAQKAAEQNNQQNPT